MAKTNKPRAATAVTPVAADSALQQLQAGAGLRAPASPARKRFDKLVSALQRQRGELHAWAKALPRWHQRHQSQLAPLLAQQRELEVALVELLDHSDATIKLAKRDRAFLSELICQLAAPLIEAGRADLEPLYHRHCRQGLDADADVSESDAMFKQMLGAAFGLSPEEVEAMESPDAAFEQAQARWHQQQEHARQRKARRQQREAAKRQADEPPPLRELYRKLAASLHPDRARDAADSQRRTVLMQRLNAAYKAGDLIGLIELQVEIGLLDAAGVDALTDARLQQYNRELSRQCQEIARELAQVEHGFCADYGLDPAARPKPLQLDKLLARCKREVEADLDVMRSDLRDLQQPQLFKRWLRQQRQLSEMGADFLYVAGDPQG